MGGGGEGGYGGFHSYHNRYNKRVMENSLLSDVHLKNQVDHSHPSTSSNFIFLEFQVHLVLISPRWRRVECGREWRR